MSDVGTAEIHIPRGEFRRCTTRQRPCRFVINGEADVTLEPGQTVDVSVDDSGAITVGAPLSVGGIFGV